MPALTPVAMPFPDPLTVATAGFVERKVTMRRVWLMTLPSFRSACPTTWAGLPEAAMVDGEIVIETRSMSGTPVMNEHPASPRPRRRR